MYEILSMLGYTFDFLGKLLVSYTAIKVHHRFWKEHKVDEVVFEEMRKERNLGLFGVFLMTVGFTLQLVFKLQLWIP